MGDLQDRVNDAIEKARKDADALLNEPEFADMDERDKTTVFISRWLNGIENALQAVAAEVEKLRPPADH